jgi:SAM-dependent methyltransferase
MRQEKGFGDYGNMAEAYDDGRMAFPQWIFDELLARTSSMDLPSDQLPVLDVGCGTGVATRQLYDVGFTRVIGTDIDPRMLAQARIQRIHKIDFLPTLDEKGSISRAEWNARSKRYLAAYHRDIEHRRILYMQTPVAELPFISRSFKVVTTFGALSWFCDDEASMWRLKHVLKQKGLLMAADEECMFTHQGLEEIKNRYAPKRPKRRRSLPPVEVLKRYNFQRIEFFERTEDRKIDFWKASNYLLAASWLNFVPKDRLAELKRDHVVLCKQLADSEGMLTWQFRFSVAFAYKDFVGVRQRAERKRKREERRVRKYLATSSDRETGL